MYTVVGKSRLEEHSLNPLRFGMMAETLCRYIATLTVDDQIILEAHQAYLQSQMPGQDALPEPVYFEAILTASGKSTSVRCEIVSLRLGDIPSSVVGRISRLLVRIKATDPEMVLVRVRKDPLPIGLYFGVDYLPRKNPSYKITHDCMLGNFEHEIWDYLASHHFC